MALYQAALNYKRRIYKEWMDYHLRDNDLKELYHEVDVLCTVLLLKELPDLIDNDANKYFHGNQNLHSDVGKVILLPHGNATP